jgi:hypothetical protein
MVEREAHDRRQIYTYLGMLDVTTPPLYRGTKKEVRERSVPGVSAAQATRSSQR